VLTVALLNQKGGVGKTSSCHHLSGTLAQMGRSVLLIDNDPQSSLTQGFFGPDVLRSLDPSRTVAALFDPGADPAPEQVIRPTPIDGVSIVPGSEHEWNYTPRSGWGPSLPGLRDLVVSVRGEYDVALIDCPPNLGLCSWAALSASDAVIVPLQAEDYGAQGILAIRRAIAGVRESARPSLALLGYLVTMFDKRLAIHAAYEQNLRDLHGPDVFDATFPLAKDFKEAVAAWLPIGHYKPKSAASRAIRAIAEEMLARADRIGFGSAGQGREVA
jgi:chromosome partitioning protein